MRVHSCAATFALCIVQAVLLAGPACAESPTSAGRDQVKPPWRVLADYPRPPRPDTGWGIHDNPDCHWKAADLDAFFKELRERYGFCWFKVLACGANKLDVTAACRRNGIEPVVRLYTNRPTPFYPREGREEAEFRALVKRYVAAGARYIESGNEPNLSVEWAEGEWEKGNRTERLCRQWLRVRPMISEAGGIPVFYAMSPGGEDHRLAGEWWEDCFRTFKAWNRIDDAFAGCAMGAHLGPLNQSLDYPFDANPALARAPREERLEWLKKRSTCYLAIEVLIALMDEYLPHRIPVLSTEGGAFPDNHDNKDYPPVTPERHRDLNLEIFERFNPAHPRYWGDPLFAQMSWNWHADAGIFARESWHKHPVYGDMPILEALRHAKRFDRGPALETRPAR